jgi:Flp pilus assembly protein TadG
MRSGAVMVETVMAIPLLIFIACWICQFAILFSHDLQLQYANYQAARSCIGDEGIDKSDSAYWKKIMPGANPVESGSYNSEPFTIENQPTGQTYNIAIQLVALEYDASIFFEQYRLERSVELIYGKNNTTENDAYNSFRSPRTIKLTSVCFTPQILEQQDDVPTFPEVLAWLLVPGSIWWLIL